MRKSCVEPRPAVKTGRRHAAATLIAIVFGVFLQGFGTSCDNGDQFRCGVARADDNSLARLCDRQGEVCVCETQRCAVRDAACAKEGFAGLKYSFGDQDCVSEEDAKSAIAQIAGGPEFCPGNGPDLPCGITGGENCGANQVCVCDGNRCADWDTTCDSRYRYVVTGDCVAPEKAQPEMMLFASDGGSGLCPGEAQLPPPCGMPLSGQAPAQCDEGQTCICAKNLFRCAVISATCDLGYRWAQDGSCVVVQDLTKDLIEASDQQVNADGLCPLFAPKDAGADGSMMTP